jgi:hypothetical protein
MIRLTILPALVRDLHSRLLDGAEAALTLPAGLAQGAGATEFLLPGAASEPGTPPDATVRVFHLPVGLEGCSHLYWHSLPPPPTDRPHLELALHERRGASAAAFVAGQLRRVDEIVLAGPGFDRWTPAITPPDPRGPVPADGRHSRYAGALGGKHVHDRLRSLACLGIASARLGSCMLMSLAKAGCTVVNVDPDVLEPHSEDAVECFPGTAPEPSPKAFEVARFAKAAAPWATIVPLAVAADAPEVLAAARHCQLIFSAPDRDEARFAAALFATALLRVHVDLGTGVFEDGSRWRAGADVRLILPGQGCLLCVGGLDLAAQPPTDWRRQRAGSLRSLNQLAVSAAMLLLERLVAGDLQRTTWTRIEVAADGTFRTRAMPVDWRGDCALCGRLTGAGERAFQPTTRA